MRTTVAPEPSLDSRIAAVLAGTRLKWFTSDTERLHRAFYRAFRKNKSLFPRMNFVVLSDYPHSPQLESALYRLQSARLVSALNPGFDLLESKPLLKQVVGLMRKKNPELTSELVNLGKEIAPLVEGRDTVVQAATGR